MEYKKVGRKLEVTKTVTEELDLPSLREQISYIESEMNTLQERKKELDFLIKKAKELGVPEELP